MATDEVRDNFAKQGVIPVKSASPEELTRYVQEEIAHWGDVVRKAGVEGSQ